MHTQRAMKFEQLETRRVLTAPSVTSLVAQPSTATVGTHITLEANVTDQDNDVREVNFYLDDGDGQLGAADQLVGSDHDGSDGWQLVFPTSSPYRILPLGDSITQPEATQQSYRYPLWTSLIDAGYSFDFVGSQNQNHAGATSWPDYQGQVFDQDHEGHYGYRADEIATSLPTWLDNATPDIALVHLGTNDLFQSQSIASTLDDLEQVITVLRQDNPNVVVLVSLLIPTNFPSNALVDAFNQALPARVPQWNTADSPVIMVDQNSQLDPVTHLYDGVHPNAVGEQIMANVWAEAIETARPVKDAAATFAPGAHTFLAVAVDETETSSNPTSTVLTLSDPNNEPPNVVVSESNTSDYGTVAGSHTLTHESDDQYQELTESLAGSLRLVQNNWKFNVPSGVSASVQLEAFHNSDNEVFYVNYSTDGASWSNILSVTKTADDDQVQVAQLPAGISGDVWIRIKDSSFSDAEDNSLFVDYLAIALEGTPEPSLPEVTLTTLTPASEAGEISGEVVVTRTGSTSEPLSISYTVGGSATPGTDYVLLSGGVTIPAGEATATISVTPIDDEDAEGDETIIISVTPQPTYDLGNAAQTVVTLSDDEQSAGTSRYFPTSEVTALGTSNSFGEVFASDDIYQELRESDNSIDAISHTWRFDIPAGSAPTLVLEARSSTPSERFYVNYSSDNSSFQNILTVSSTTDSVQTYALPDGLTGSVFIKVRDSNSQEGTVDTLFVDQLYIEVDDSNSPNLPQVSVAATLATVEEPSGSPGVFTFSRTGDLATSLLVDIVVAGSATPAEDYITLPTQIEFSSGQAEVTLNVSAIDDELPEPNETVTLQLVASSSYVLASAAYQAAVTIRDDDSVNTDQYAVSEILLAGSQNGNFTETFSSDDSFEELIESANGSLQLEWLFEVPSLTAVSLHLEGFTTSTNDVFWVNYSTDGINYRNIATIANSSEAVLVAQIPDPVNGTVYIKIRDSNRAGDVLADSVFIDELKLITS